MGNCTATLQPIRRLPWRVQLARTWETVTFRKANGELPASEGKQVEVKLQRKRKRALPSACASRTKKVSPQLVPLDDGNAGRVPPESPGREASADGGQRIKVVVSKRQLELMLSSVNMSLEDMLADIHKRKEDHCPAASHGWRPRLETIHE